jgi:hypothetical protein
MLIKSIFNGLISLVLIIIPCVTPVLVELMVNVGVGPLTVIGVALLLTIVVAVLG